MAEGKDAKREDGDEAEAAETSKKGGGKKTLIIAAGVTAAVLLILGIVITVMVIKSRTVVKPVEEVTLPEGEAGQQPLVKEGAGEEDELEEGEEPLGAIFPLDSFVVNLKGGRFLRAQIQLEFIEREVPSRFRQRIVPIKDGILILLSNRTADELLSQKGKDTLKKDVKDLVNEMLHKEYLKEVYVTQFVVQ